MAWGAFLGGLAKTAATSAASSFGSNLFNGSDQSPGQAHNQFMNEAYPGTNAWERLGASGNAASSGAATRSQSKQLATQKSVAQIGADAQVKSAQIHADAARANTGVKADTDVANTKTKTDTNVQTSFYGSLNDAVSSLKNSDNSILQWMGENPEFAMLAFGAASASSAFLLKSMVDKWGKVAVIKARAQYLSTRKKVPKSAVKPAPKPARTPDIQSWNNPKLNKSIISRHATPTPNKKIYMPKNFKKKSPKSGGWIKVLRKMLPFILSKGRRF